MTKNCRSVGEWHKKRQDFFEKKYQEIKFTFLHYDENDNCTQKQRRADVYKDETVIEYQHSRITIKEVNSRNHDYTSLGKRIIWILDCTENVNRPDKLSTDVNEEEKWLIDFEKKWQVESMKECNVVYADFGDDIFRVPIQSVKQRMVVTGAPWHWDDEFRNALASDIPEYVPPQSTLTVAQDPHGSGKTYRLTTDIINIEDHYDTQIIVTKSHAAKQVVYREFMDRLNKTGIEHNDNTNNNKYIVKFTKTNGLHVTCIFGTVDSLIYNIGNRKICGTDLFVDLVKSIHQFGPTKLQGPKGRISYAGEKPRVNKKLKIIVDEATMLTEDYANAFSTLMSMCSCDVHLAGDVQQSTLYKKNLLRKIMEECILHGTSIPSFPSNVKVSIKKGNKVRRFNQDLVTWRNIIMHKFVEEPSHNLQIPRPEAATDVEHVRGIPSVHLIDNLRPFDDAESEELLDAADDIMDKFDEDVATYDKLPNDFIFVTPFVKNNPLMDAVQSRVHEYWNTKFNDTQWCDKMQSIHGQKFEKIIQHFENIQSKLDWKCVFHRSEEGKPIDTRESEYATRIVSIHASQGDGRDVAYIVGLRESALKRFSGGFIDIQYESLLNVAISRMKEIVRVFLGKTYDDIFQRFIPVMSAEMIKQVPPTLDAKYKFNLQHSNIDNVGDDNKLYNMVKDRIVYNEESGHDKPLVDYSHHMIRMAVATTIFHANILIRQCNRHEPAEPAEQATTIFRQFAYSEVKLYDSKEYYKIYRKHETYRKIPVLDYNDGRALFKETRDRIIEKLKNVQLFVREWLNGIDTNLDKIKPEDAVVLQYGIEIVKLYPICKEDVKMDHVYDVVACYMNKNEETREKLQSHYDHITNIQSLYENITKNFHDDWQWKIFRSINLGNKTTGQQTQHFLLKSQISHLVIDDHKKEAIPILLVPDIDELNIASICCQVLLNTLVCTQPEQKTTDKSKPTWQYVEHKNIKICIAPVKKTQPIIVNVMDIVEENIEIISEWLKICVDRQLRIDLPQAHKIAEYYNNFDTAKKVVREAYEGKKCPEYMYDAFKNSEECDEVKEELEKELKRHLKRFKRDIVARL